MANFQKKIDNTYFPVSKPSYLGERNCKEKNEKDKKSQFKNKFSPEEDEVLKRVIYALVERNPEILGDEANLKKTINWQYVASQMHTKRNARQCRDRWLNYLSPSVVNGPWTPEEDNLLIQKYNDIGPYWKKIATFFPSRTDINLKSRWNWLVRQNNKQKLEFQKKIWNHISLDGKVQMQNYVNMFHQPNSNKVTQNQDKSTNSIQNTSHRKESTTYTIDRQQAPTCNCSATTENIPLSMKEVPQNEEKGIELQDNGNLFDYDYKRLGFNVDVVSKPPLQMNLNHEKIS